MSSRDRKKCHFLIGTRWFGILGPCYKLIDELNDSGYRVFVFGQIDSHYSRYFKDNCTLVQLNMRRSYFSFFYDFLDILKLVYYFCKYRPVGVHSFNPKPALISAFVCRLFPKVKFFIGVTGLGNTFIRAPRLRSIIEKFLRNACDRASFVFFQNPDDVEFFKSRNLAPETKRRLFIGPGVDLDFFSPKDYSKPSGDEIVVITMARLIWQKGIREYVEAARKLLESGSGKFRFIILGEFDFDHPDCVDPSYIDAAVQEGVVEHIPWTDSVSEILQQADIFVLHSYREGAPRAILEASACALPTVGADAIGVRELVIDGVTGFLTPLKDVDALKEVILKLSIDPELRKRLGQSAYEKIAKPFSLENSTQAQLSMYRDSGFFN